MRITQAHLKNLTEWLNDEKGYPAQAWIRDENGHSAQILHIYVQRCSGSWHVNQMVNTGGGVRCLRSGTAREVYEFLRGMQEAVFLDDFKKRITGGTE
jgi:hypothetical protein